jgi:hypothetical protein
MENIRSHVKKNIYHILIAISFYSFFACKPPPREYSDSLSSKDPMRPPKYNHLAPMSPIRNSEDQTASCWAETTVRYFQSLYKLRTGGDIALSYHALYYYHWLALLKKEIEKAKSEKEIIAFTDLLIEGYSTITPGSNFFGTFESEGALDLIKKHGLMPRDVYKMARTEEEFTKKEFTGRSQKLKTVPVDSFYKFQRLEVADNILHILERNGLDSLRNLSEDDIAHQILLSRFEMNFVKAPPTSFEFSGKKFTPSSFVKEELKIDVNALVAKNVSNQKFFKSHNSNNVDFKTFLSDVETNYLSNISTPIISPLSYNRIEYYQDRVYWRKAKINHQWVDHFFKKFEKRHPEVVKNIEEFDPKNIDYDIYKVYVALKTDPSKFFALGYHGYVILGFQQDTSGSDKSGKNIVADPSALGDLPSAGVKNRDVTKDDGLEEFEMGYLEDAADVGYIEYISPKKSGSPPFL